VKTRKSKGAKRRATGAAKRLAETDKAQYETERMFAAENVVKRLLEGAHNMFVFDFAEGDEDLGSCELNGVDDDRDENGRGGAWVCVRIYVPNLDIDTEIES
jgi:hypothetical protein